MICPKHTTDADYLCCDPCDNVFVCLYCSHRDHVSHSFGFIQNHTQKIKGNLQHELQNINDFNKRLEITLQQTESDVSMGKYILDETLKYRKLLCLNDYLQFFKQRRREIKCRILLCYIKPPKTIRF